VKSEEKQGIGNRKILADRGWRCAHDLILRLRMLVVKWKTPAGGGRFAAGLFDC